MEYHLIYFKKSWQTPEKTKIIVDYQLCEKLFPAIMGFFLSYLGNLGWGLRN